jgi:hypothetical protein
VARARDVIVRGVIGLAAIRRGSRTLAFGLVAMGAAAMSATDAAAQANRRSAPPRVQPEARADYIDGRVSAAHLGIGFSVPAGTYVRLGGIAAAGQAWSDGDTGVAGRVDALARFVVDPLRESRWAPYASGGIGALFDERDRWRAVLVGALGIEGPPAGAVVPAVEVGFGGGVRVGIAFRRSMAGRR